MTGFRVYSARTEPPDPSMPSYCVAEASVSVAEIEAYIRAARPAPGLKVEPVGEPFADYAEASLAAMALSQEGNCRCVPYFSPPTYEVRMPTDDEPSSRALDEAVARFRAEIEVVREMAPRVFAQPNWPEWLGLTEEEALRMSSSDLMDLMVSKGMN